MTVVSWTLHLLWSSSRPAGVPSGGTSAIDRRLPGIGLRHRASHPVDVRYGRRVEKDMDVLPALRERLHGQSSAG